MDINGFHTICVARVTPTENLETLDTKVRKGNLYFYFVTSVNTKGIESELRNDAAAQSSRADHDNCRADHWSHHRTCRGTLCVHRGKVNEEK